jgi:Tfp pilus assembly protein PilN
MDITLMDITLNLATQSYQMVQRFRALWKLIIAAVALVAFVLLCGSVAAYLSWRAGQRQIAQLNKQIEELDREKDKMEVFLDRPESREVRVRSEFLNSAIARKAFSWTEVFTDLEHVIPPQLYVTSIHHEVNSDGQIELHLSVRGAKKEAAIELVRRLEQSSHFAQAQIHDERFEVGQKAQSGDAVEYIITAIYIPKFARKPEGKMTLQTNPTTPEVASNRNETLKESADARH